MKKLLLVNLLCLIIPMMLWGPSSQDVLHIPFRVVQWNVENLFDTRHDSLKSDHEFLPSAIRRWNRHKYWEKIEDVAKVIAAIGGWTPPALVGLCEVENDTVLRDLTRYSPLKELGYRYVMTASPDERGIDVALLYQRDVFKLLQASSVTIKPLKRFSPTRDLLHVSGLLLTGDTLDVIVCHFPSRAGGEKETEPYRIHAAKTLRVVADSLIRTRAYPQILIMGDFNDPPANRSISEAINATTPPETPRTASALQLYNLLSHISKNKDFGTYKYQGRWEVFDQLIVSGNLLNNRSSFYTGEEKTHICKLPFLLSDDSKYGGVEPHRTYKGMRYQGGISDHLPVFTDFELILKM